MNFTTIDYSNTSAFVFICDYMNSNLERHDGEEKEFFGSNVELDYNRLAVDITYLQLTLNRLLTYYIELYNEDYEYQCFERDSHIEYWIYDAFYEHTINEYEGEDKIESFISNMTTNFYCSRGKAYLYWNHRFSRIIDSDFDSSSDSDDSDDSDDSEISNHICITINPDDEDIV